MSLSSSLAGKKHPSKRIWRTECWRFSPHRTSNSCLGRLHKIQRKVKSGSDMNSRALFILFGQLMELLDKKTLHDTRFKAEQEKDLPLGTTVKGRVRPAKNEMTKIRRMKAPCPSQAQVHPLGRHICGTHICLLHLFHHWLQQQAEMFLTGWSESCCLHGFPQHSDALSVSK